jgi:hypothetical protein
MNKTEHYIGLPDYPEEPVKKEECYNCGTEWDVNEMRYWEDGDLYFCPEGQCSHD